MGRYARRKSYGHGSVTSWEGMGDAKGKWKWKADDVIREWYG